MDKAKRDFIRSALLLAAATSTPQSLLALAQTSGKPFRVELEGGGQLEITADKVFLVKGRTRKLAPDGTYNLDKAGGSILINKGTIKAVEGPIRNTENIDFMQDIKGVQRVGKSKQAAARKTWRAFNKKTGQEVNHTAPENE